MTYFLLIAAIVLAICTGVGLVRVFIGPSIEDRMISAQLIATSGVGLLLLLGTLLELPTSIDIVLILLLLVAFFVAAFSYRTQFEEFDND